jgi:phage FluMu gp28-like protein
MNVTDYHQFMLEHVFKGFQKEILQASLTHSKVAVLGSRQIGKSYITSYIAIMLGLGTTKAPGHDVLVISENQDKARKIISDIHSHLDKMERVCGPLRKANRGGLFEVVLINGTSIVAKPGKPTALQGFTGSVLVDELSLSQFDPEDLFAQALIVSSAQSYFKAIFLTNADKTGTFVHNLFRNTNNEWNDRRKGMAVLEFNVYDVYPELPEKIVQIKNTIHEKLWRCFYLNDFVSSNISFLDHDLIEESKTVEISHKDPITILAYDPGFSKDGSGIVVAKVSDKISVIEEHLIFGMEIQEQLEFIHTLLERHQIGSIVFDQGVGGIVVGQQLKRRYGALVKPQSINRNFYQKTSAELERLFYEGKIQIPAKCENLIQDLKSFEKTSRGLFSVPHRLTPQGRTHCDVGVALLMLLVYLQETLQPFKMETINVGHTFGKFI